MVKKILHITEKAEQYLKGYLADHPEAKGVRFAIKKSGCSGYRYVTECASEVHDTDEQYMISGIVCLIDKESKPMLSQLTLDYKTVGPGVAHLVYINPNATNECGCGESFSYIGNEAKDKQDD